MPAPRTEAHMLGLLLDRSPTIATAKRLAELVNKRLSKYPEPQLVGLRTVERFVANPPEPASRPRNSRWLCMAVLELNATYEQAERLLSQHHTNTFILKQLFNSETDESLIWDIWPRQGGRIPNTRGIDLLGVKPEAFSETDRCVILLPTFPGEKDTRNVTHARADVLAANDLSRMFVRAGLRQPVLEKADKEVLKKFANSVWPVVLRDERDRPYVVKQVISIGIFSQPFLYWLINTELTNMRMSTPDEGKHRKQRWVQPTPGVTLNWKTKKSDGEKEDDGRARGIFGRLNYPDMVINIIGGMNSVGSTRVTEMICDRSDQFWASPDQGGNALLQGLADNQAPNFFATIEGPRTGRRGSDTYQTSNITTSPASVHTLAKLVEDHRKRRRKPQSST